MAPRRPFGGFWRSKDFQLRLLAVFLAVVLWFVVSTETGPRVATATVIANVATRGLAPGLVVLEPPSPVEVTLQGPRGVLSLAKEQTQAYVDLDGLSTGTHPVAVQVVPPPGARVLSLQPLQVRVALDRIISREFPVTIGLVTVPPGFDVGTSQPDPTRARVEGPATLVGRVLAVMARVAVDTVPRGAPTSVDLMPIDARGNVVEGVSLLPPSARVTIVLNPTPAQAGRRLSVRVRVTGSPAPGYKVVDSRATPSEVTVTQDDPSQPAPDTDGAGESPGAPTQSNDEERPAAIWTEPVDVSDATAPIRRRVRLVPPPGEIVTPEEVEVVVEIEPEVAESIAKSTDGALGRPAE